MLKTGLPSSPNIPYYSRPLESFGSCPHSELHRGIAFLLFGYLIQLWFLAFFPLFIRPTYDRVKPPFGFPWLVPLYNSSDTALSPFLLLSLASIINFSTCELPVPASAEECTGSSHRCAQPSPGQAAICLASLGASPLPLRLISPFCLWPSSTDKRPSLGRTGPSLGEPRNARSGESTGVYRLPEPQQPVCCVHQLPTWR